MRIGSILVKLALFGEHQFSTKRRQTTSVGLFGTKFFKGTIKD
jgi:hypothetical protein